MVLVEGDATTGDLVFSSDVGALIEDNVLCRECGAGMGEELLSTVNLGRDAGKD